MLKGMERVLVVGASADSSILDVETGWLSALESAGYIVYNYSLRNRLKMWGEILGVLKSGRKCGDCGADVVDPYPPMAEADQVTVMQAASDCIVHEAIRHNAAWAVIISGCSLHPNAAVFLQRVGIPIVTIVTESPYNDEDMFDLARASTLVAINERTSVPYFQEVTQSTGGEAMYLSTAFSAKVHQPGLIDSTKQSDVFFCGTGFDERARLFAEADWSGVDFKLAGFWPTSTEQQVIPNAIEERLGQVRIGHEPSLKPFITGGLLDNAEVVEWYRAAKIVLSIHRDDPRAESFGPRVYETAAVGAFQICDDSRPEVQEVFGPSVPLFRAGDSDDMMRVIRHYLARPAERASLAAEAMRRVQNHSYDHRLASLEAEITRLKSSG